MKKRSDQVASVGNGWDYKFRYRYEKFKHPNTDLEGWPPPSPWKTWSHPPFSNIFKQEFSPPPPCSKIISAEWRGILASNSQQSPRPIWVWEGPRVSWWGYTWFPGCTMAKIEENGQKIPEILEKCEKWKGGMVKIHVPTWYKLCNNWVTVIYTLLVG